MSDPYAPAVEQFDSEYLGGGAFQIARLKLHDNVPLLDFLIQAQSIPDRAKLTGSNLYCYRLRILYAIHDHENRGD